MATVESFNPFVKLLQCTCYKRRLGVQSVLPNDLRFNFRVFLAYIK